MVEDLFYYENYPPKKRREFCRRNDLDYLPRKSNKALMEFKDPEFEQVYIEDSNLVFNPSENILDEAFTGPFHQKPVRFALSDEEFVGVVHYSDYNCRKVYFKAYKLLYKIEQRLRYLLEKHHLENEVNNKRSDVDNKKSDEDEEFAHLSQAQFRGVLKASYHFADELDIEFFKSMGRRELHDEAYSKDSDPLEKYVDFRNRIMHAKEFVSLDEKSKRKSNYNFKSFKTFLESAKDLEELYTQLEHLEDEGVHEDNVSLTRLR